MGNLKVFVLLAGMVALFGVVGGMIGGQGSMLIALAIASVMSVVMLFNSGKMALRAYQAHPEHVALMNFNDRFVMDVASVDFTIGPPRPV